MNKRDNRILKNAEKVRCPHDLDAKVAFNNQLSRCALKAADLMEFYDCNPFCELGANEDYKICKRFIEGAE